MPVLDTNWSNASFNLDEISKNLSKFFKFPFFQLFPGNDLINSSQYVIYVSFIKLIIKCK